MWKFLRVDITDINPSVPRETFSETELENLADLIIEMGGLIRPVILKKADNKKLGERYDIISGDLEYYASVVASQKSPDIEMINAFVIDKEAESIALQQIQFRDLENKRLPRGLARGCHDTLYSVTALVDLSLELPTAKEIYDAYKHNNAHFSGVEAIKGGYHFYSIW